MTDQERKAKISALLEERRGYEQRGLDDRVAAVDASLRALGAGGRAPAKRAEKRPAAAKGETRG